MSLWVRFRRDQRGISAVLVSICLIAIFGAAMLSVDAGQLWTYRRNAVTGTDASALAQARYFALNPGLANINCTSGVWDSVLSSNVNDTFGSTCRVLNLALNGTSGVVIVTTHKRSPARFSGVLGIGGSAAFSMSAAMWGFVPNPVGLRPIALCVNDAHIHDALYGDGVPASEQHVAGNPAGDYNAPDGSKDYWQTTHSLNGPGIVHHISFTASMCDSQSTVPGNFGWVDLDANEPGGNNNSNGHNPPNSTCADPNSGTNNCGTSDWLQYGYYGNQVSLGGTTDCDTQKNNPQNCIGDPGVSDANSIDSALNFLMDPNGDGVKNPLTIPVILYDHETTGSGQNAQFHLYSIAMVRIWDYKLNNPNNRYLDLEFMDNLVTGVCCSATNPNPNGPAAEGTRICDVDHDSGDPNLAAARCVLS